MGASARILLSCGEVSGDLYLARVARALRERRPDLQLVGVCGPAGRAAGVESYADMESLRVMGFAEVVRHLPRLRRLGDQVVKRALQERVDVFVPVDYPGWHMGVARRLREAGVTVVDFIPPKTWSWGSWRLRSLRRAVDRCAVIFPFEVEHYRTAGVDATFVGHPLLDLHAQALALPPVRDRGLLLVPGSRRQELQRLATPMVETVRRLRAKGCTPDVTVSRAPGVEDAWLAPFFAGIENLSVEEGPLFEALLRHRAAVVCSGTASLEAALAAVPHVIVYRTSGPTYAIARRLARVEHIGMANIVLGERAFPEFLQGECRASTIAPAVQELFPEEGPALRRQAEASRRLREALGGGGAFARVADLILDALSVREEMSR